MAFFVFPFQEVPVPPVLADALLRHTVHDCNKFTVCNCLKCTEDKRIKAVPFRVKISFLLPDLYDADIASVLFLFFFFFALTV